MFDTRSNFSLTVFIDYGILYYIKEKKCQYSSTQQSHICYLIKKEQSTFILDEIVECSYEQVLRNEGNGVQGEKSMSKNSAVKTIDPDIVVVVRGGQAEVTKIPAGLTVQIKDYDIESGDGLSDDGDGDLYLSCVETGPFDVSQPPH